MLAGRMDAETPTPLSPPDVAHASLLAPSSGAAFGGAQAAARPPVRDVAKDALARRFALVNSVDNGRLSRVDDVGWTS